MTSISAFSSEELLLEGDPQIDSVQRVKDFRVLNPKLEVFNQIPPSMFRDLWGAGGRL